MMEKFLPFPGERRIFIIVIIIGVLIFGFGIYVNIKAGVEILLAIAIAWTRWVGPVFGSLAIALTLFGIFCMLKYWPLRTNIKMFEAKHIKKMEERRKI